jgi:multicomponent Na+:H+ antiporter subunit D
MTSAALALLVPVLGACGLAAASPLVSSRRAGAPAIAVGVATLALCAVVLGGTDGRVVAWFGGWHPRGGAAIGVAFAIDPLGGALAVFVAALGVTALVLAARLIVVEDLLFDALVLVFLAAMVGFAFSGDLFDQFVFLELMAIAGVVLVGYEVGQRAPLEGSLTFGVTMAIGSILLLFGIGLVYGRTGALNLAQIGRELDRGPLDLLVVMAFALIAAGMLVKAAIVPFHLWTADAYAVAPTPICILLAGAFAELGLYGLFRIYWTAFAGVMGGEEEVLRAVLVGAGALSAVLGAVMCLAQHHLKRLLAFATIAQVGLFLMGLGLLSVAGVAGVALWAAGDGLVKAALFACVAAVQHRWDSTDERELHGRGRSLWPLGIVFAACALVIASSPPSGSFLGRALVEDAALAAPGYAWVPAVLAGVNAIVAGALLRVAARVFAGWGRPARRDARAGGADEDTTAERDQPDRGAATLWLPAAVLALIAILGGLTPGLADAAARAAGAFVDTHAYAAAVLDGARATIPDASAPGPTATALLYAAGSTAGAFAIAAAALRGAALPRPVHRSVEWLRAMHDGRPGSYAAWTVAGTAVMAAVLTIGLR